MKVNLKICLFLLFSFVLNFASRAQTATFSQTYTNGATATAQCAAWNAFVSSLSSSGNYIKMTISGTYDATGISCTDKTIVNAFVAAIKSNSTYISATTGGHVWSICNRYSGEIWIDPPASCSGSNCPNPGYIIRPCITNLNWGGVNTATCGGPNQVMTLKFEMPTKPNDAGISFISTPLCAPDIYATYNNYGTNTLDSAKINWSVNGTLQTQNKYTTSIPQNGKSVNVTLTPTYNFVDGNNYTVKVWTSLPNNKFDSVPANDTFTISFKYVGPALDPKVTDFVKCGPGQALLQAIPGNAADSVVWYDTSSGGNIIARGKNALSPPLTYGLNTFYAQASKIGTPKSLANSMTPSVGYGSTYSGGFANITPKIGVIIDSFCVVLTSNIQNATFNVYMRNGTYIGYNTTPSAWTKLVSNGVSRVRQVGSYYRAYIKIPETLLDKGVTYGFYITTTPVTTSSPWSLASVSGGITTTGTDLVVFQDRICYGGTEFATPNTNYPLTWETHYRPSNCPSNRVPLNITVKPSPHGASFIKGSLFQTTMPFTNGTKGNPDIVAKGDKLSYEITPPTGYNNSDYGTTWVMSNFTLRTPKGTIIPTTFYTPTSPTPTGSSNATVTFMPDGSLTDSTIIMTMQLKDLGPYYCDSTITRYIFVAPRPNVDFKFPQPLCDGDNVIFTNASTVSSGNLYSRWNFGTGNPADTSNNTDAVFTYPTHGVYLVKLITSTVPYGYKDSITQSVEITEIPKIGFKVYNACMGDSVSFVNSTTISKGTITYLWNFGNGSTSSKVSPKQKYANSGSYKVTLTASAKGCTRTLTKNAWTFARPKASFIFPPSLCDKTDIEFFNTSTISTGNMGYNWTFSDGSKSTLVNAVHSFANAGTKTVKLKAVSEFGCTDSTTKNITLMESPLADFKYGAACNQSKTQFSFTGMRPANPITTIFHWDFGSYGTTTVENPAILFSVIGKKIVTLTLTSNNGCSDKISKEINVKLQSKADFNTSDVCENEVVVFSNKSTVSSGSLNYLWKFGDGTYSNIHSPRHMYISPVSKTYNVTLVALVPGGCSDSVSKPVTVNTNPISDYNYTKSGRLVYFNALQSGNTTYHWDFGEGGTSETPTTQYHYINAFEYGKFNVCLTVTNASGCFTQTCKTLEITGDVKNITKSEGFKLFPNPSSGNFTLSVENPKNDITVSIYNLVGEKVKEQKLNPLEKNHYIELKAAEGVYLVKLINNNNTYIQKITLNK
ncbi:MAG: PKD domain-containing protein [Bacteroidetes bacterium]|nr:PKD domain-containing protein [Bacteroidota bacterium]